MGEPDPAPVAVAFDLRSIPAGRAILHLKTWAPRASLSLADLDSSGHGTARLLALGPGEWLLTCDGVEGPRLQTDIAELARSHDTAAVDVSDGMAGLQLAGSAARDILSTACGLDLHPPVFPVGTCTRTRLAQLPVIIVCAGVRHYELYVGASYAAYLEGWLRDAGTAFPS